MKEVLEFLKEWKQLTKTRRESVPGIRYQMIRTLFKVIGVNKMLDKQGENFEKPLAEYQKKQKKPPHE